MVLEGYEMRMGYDGNAAKDGFGDGRDGDGLEEEDEGGSMAASWL